MNRIAATEYQVRLSGSGRIVWQTPSVEDAEDCRDDQAAQGFRAYVVFVELVDGEWVAQED